MQRGAALPSKLKHCPSGNSGTGCNRVPASLLTLAQPKARLNWNISQCENTGY